MELLARLKEASLEVSVKLKDDSIYRGVVEEHDPAMNLVLNEAVQLNEDGNLIAKYGRVFIRGSSIVYIFVQNGSVVI